jgi:S-DNA-T family DNA segregation ATPase FtsK/SpoIIIE
MSEDSPNPDIELTDEERAKTLVDQYGTYDQKLDLASYQYPPLELLNDYASRLSMTAEELDVNKNKIVETLNYAGITITNIKATIGPSVILYELIPAPGMRVAKIKGLEADIALALAAAGTRVIGPIPGKGTIGIEVPHAQPDIVSIRSLLATAKFQNTAMELPIAIGKTMNNEVWISDLAKMPHLLIAGATGQGKSVSINSILVSLLYKKHPAELKFVLIDISGLEFALFRKIERHFLAKLPDAADAIITDIGKAVSTLNSVAIELDQRYDLLKSARVRTITEYNHKFINRKISDLEKHRYLPFMVVVIDEFADLIAASNEVELLITRLAQLGRPAGIHLIIATQRPSVKIITGTIKANFTARLAFRVATTIDSRTIIDMGGAEQLHGEGDMLLQAGAETIHLQGGFVETDEIKSLADFIGLQRSYPTAMLLPEYFDGSEISPKEFDPNDRDPMFEESARLIVMQSNRINFSNPAKAEIRL